VDLSNGRETPLDARTRAGCWLNDKQFAAATDTELFLFGLDGRSAGPLRGPWLPRAGAGERLIACTAGCFQSTFGLVCVTVIVKAMQPAAPPGMVYGDGSRRLRGRKKDPPA